MFSFTGIPITLGFWGKFYVFQAAIKGGEIGLALIGLLASLFSAYYYLRVLVVMTPTRSSIFPDVPTVAESGFPGFEASVWYGFIGPAALPAPVVARLHAEIQRALASDDVKGRLAAAGGEVLPGPTDRFKALLDAERIRYEKLIRDAKILPD